MTATITLLNPTAPRRGSQVSQARAHTSLKGLVVAFIDNAKPNFEHLAADLGELLRSEYGVREVITHRKRSATLACDPAVLDDLCEKCDLVITGSGDCGSCTSWSIHDNVEAARRGVRSITICSSAFANFGRMQAKSLGSPDIKIAVIPHPFSARRREQVKELAALTVVDIERLATGATTQ